MNHLKSKKTIFIPGGTGGIGSALIALLDKNEWNTVITGRKNSSRLKNVMKSNNLELGFEWDAGDKKKMHIIVKEIVKRYGTIDCLVNCVGVTYTKPFEKIDEKSVIDEYRINVLGTIYPIQESIPYFQKNTSGGKIINISSVRGLTQLSSTRSITYSMTKAAIINLTSSLAKQYSPKIQVNAIAPGFTLTSMSTDWGKSTWDSANNKNIYKRPANPDEIANHILFLLSDKCNYMTGQTILVDGGYSLYDK